MHGCCTATFKKRCNSHASLNNMKKIFLILVFITTYSNATGQVEKIFIDEHFFYQISRTHVRWLNLTTKGATIQDTLITSIEVSNTGRYDYHPIVWHMVDSFLYAVEIVRQDDLFVRARLIRYTIPLFKKNDKKYNMEQVKKTRKAFNYVQILDRYLFNISEREKGIEKPMYFDVIIDKEGIITIAILEVNKKTISIFSKSIAEHEKEESDKIPLYKWINTWKKINTFSTIIQSPFRILKENNKYYVVDSDGTLFEAKEKNFEKVRNEKSEPIALLFDKDAKKDVQFLTLNIFEKEKNINRDVTM
jgi:hypothetical protein